MNLLHLISIVNYALRFVSFLIIARVIVSWLVPHAMYGRHQHPVVRFVFEVTDPIIDPIRKALPRGRGALGMIDWSPLVALILIDFLRYGIIQLLIRTVM